MSTQIKYNPALLILLMPYLINDSQQHIILTLIKGSKLPLIPIKTDDNQPFLLSKQSHIKIFLTIENCSPLKSKAGLI